MKDIVIIGSGGLAKEIAFLIEEINRAELRWNILGFITDDEKLIGEKHGNYKIINSEEWLYSLDKELYIALGIGTPSIIKKIIGKLGKNKNLRFPNLIHPNVVGDWDNITIGNGNTICSNSIFTTDIKIDSFNLFNLACTIGHDSIVGSYNVINPGVNISGGVYIEDNILIGTGSQLLQYKKIVSNSIVGAGSVVTKDISTPGTYIGVPAKKL